MCIANVNAKVIETHGKHMKNNRKKKTTQVTYPDKLFASQVKPCRTKRMLA